MLIPSKLDKKDILLKPPSHRIVADHVRTHMSSHLTHQQVNGRLPLTVPNASDQDVVCNEVRLNFRLGYGMKETNGLLPVTTSRKMSSWKGKTWESILVGVHGTMAGFM